MEVEIEVLCKTCGCIGDTENLYKKIGARRNVPISTGVSRTNSGFLDLKGVSNDFGHISVHF